MDVYQFIVEQPDGSLQSLDAFRGDVLLIVNTASQCGFTPQYGGLQALYEQYHDAGLQVLGFPCNQFGHQEPGGNDEIVQFCERTYRVTFPIFAKVEVNGPRAHPLFQYLKSEAKGVLGTSSIKWNFTKFLVNRQGQVVKRFAPNTAPQELVSSLERELSEHVEGRDG